VPEEFIIPAVWLDVIHHTGRPYHWWLFLGTQNAERMSLVVARPIEILSIIIWPIVKFFELIARGMSRLLGSRKEKHLSEEELKSIVTMGRDEGILSKDAARIMHNVLRFERKKVINIMTPKVSMHMLDGDAKLGDVLNFIIKSPYSRFPIYEENKDKIIGILDVDDILKYIKSNRLGVRIKNISRPPLFVPESKDVDDMLADFEGKKTPVAIVVDEYGYVIGLVTLEDVMEEIVGDIFDKSRKSSVYIRKESENLIRVDAKASVEEINKALHLGLEEKHFNTIAGFVEGKLQRIPKRGEEIKLKNITIIVDQVTDQSIKSVKIVRN
ncbi:MAG: hemolysin family protein, partial [Nanoarchaeota archaeon]|nr:hemolysin family protein [Nanoarchaeota archaeon]